MKKNYYFFACWFSMTVVECAILYVLDWKVFNHYLYSNPEGKEYDYFSDICSLILFINLWIANYIIYERTKKLEITDNDRNEFLIKNVIQKIKKYVGVYQKPPEDLLKFVKFWNDLIYNIENKILEIKGNEDLVVEDAAGAEVVFIHTFSKYGSPSLRAIKWAEQGIYIQETIDYPEKVSVKRFMENIRNDYFFLMDEIRTKNINMDIFNKNILPKLEKFLLENLENLEFDFVFSEVARLFPDIVRRH